MAEENVVISGIGGCFPNCNDIEEFKTALYEKTNLITDMTSDWTGGLKVPSHLGRIQTLFDFDHTFLSISRSQANSMDKTCKSFIHYGYACILDSGYSPTELRGRNIGCFMHTTLSDDETRNSSDFTTNTAGTDPVLVGLARTMYANRISAYFDFHGTSVSHQGPYDGAFSTLKLAYDEVTSGKVEAAVVGVSTLCVNPHPGLQYKGLGLLTNDPVNRPLDENANGFIRADSVVLFFLQRKVDARKSYGELVQIGTYFYGDRLGTFVSRDEKNIIRLLEETYRKSGLKPCDISYLETGSWANKDLDTQELKLIRKVFAEGRADPLLIGSVVGNTGFTEGSAGFVALVKCILALRTGVIAPTLHVEKPNAVIDDKLKIVTENTPCENFVAANVFGLSGNFAHVILKKSEMKAKVKEPLQEDLPRLYLMAARNIEDSETLFNKLNATERNEYLAATMCNVFRKEIRGYMARCFAVHPCNKKEIQQSKVYESNSRPVWFLFSGMGSQWQAMGKDLMKFPVFANTIAKCAAVLKQKGLDLVYILTNEDDTTIFDNILHSFVGIASVQIALVDMLFTMGIKPDGMIGHSVGELGCAYADGCITAEESILVAFARGKASQEATLIHGMMAAVGMGQNEVTPHLPADIDVACRNSATSCTLSGPTESVEKFVDALIQKGVFAKAVNVSNIAYHSRYIKPAAPLLLESLKNIICQPKERSSKWISTSIEEHNWNSDLAKYASAEYFTNNLLSPVFFEEGTDHVPKNAILIEIAPHGLLQAIVKKSMESETLHIALTNRSKSIDNIECLLEAIGNLYLNGCEPDVNAIYPKIEYPIPADVPSITQFLTWDFSMGTNSVLVSGGSKTFTKEYVLGICSKQKYQHLLNYKIGGKFIMPPAIYIDLLIDFYTKENVKADHVAIENFRLYDCDTSIVLREKSSIAISICKGTGCFEITLENHRETVYDEPVILATGHIKPVEEVKHNIPEWTREVGFLRFNDYLKNLKFSIPENCCVEKLIKYTEGLTGEVLSKGHTFDLIDNCLKVVTIEKSDYKRPQIPYFIQSIVFNVQEILEYKKGKSVQFYYDPVVNEIVSSAIRIRSVKTKEVVLDDPEPHKDYKGPVDYLTSMNYATSGDVDVAFIGISTQCPKHESIVDYSGVTPCGEQVMGVVSYINSMIGFDEFLIWDVPPCWSLEQAVTIPAMYSIAYLCLIKDKACYRSRWLKSVFIQCGDTALGEACIALALYMKKRVYTTVSSEEGRNILLKRFPQLPASDVFMNTNYDYYLSLMLKNDEDSMQTVINPLQDQTHVNICLELAAVNGELIQIGINEAQSIGSGNFLKSKSFYSLDLSVLVSCDEATKRDIHEFISEGIRSGLVKPLAAKSGFGSFEQNSWQLNSDASYNVIALNNRQAAVSSKLNINPDSSYGIIGGEGIHLVLEWLMRNGARKFIIEYNEDFRANKMSPLLDKYGAVVMVSRNNTDSSIGTEAFLADVRSLGDMAAVFAVNLRGANCKLKLDNVRQVCANHRSSSFLCSLLCSGRSSWHYEIQADNEKTILEVLTTLQESLSLKPNANGYKNFNSNLSSKINNNHLDLSLNAHLPLQDLREVYDLYGEMSYIENPCFVEQMSLSLKNRFVRDVMPVFCFPGLCTASMKNLIKGLVYPSFLAYIPPRWKLDDIAVSLYKSLKEIQPRGIYTLVTESWSGIFALKLAEYLEKKGDKVTVILLDASPTIFKDILRGNKEVFASEQNLATYIMQGTNHLLIDAQKRTSLELSCKIILDRVRHHTETEVNYKFNGQCVLVTSEQSSADIDIKDQYKVSILVTSEHCEQSSADIDIKDQYKMFKTISSIHMTSVLSPFEFSSDRGVVKFINENVPVTWW